MDYGPTQDDYNFETMGKMLLKWELWVIEFTANLIQTPQSPNYHYITISRFIAWQHKKT